MKPTKIRLEQPYNTKDLTDVEIPKEFTAIEEFFVDSSGFGKPTEMALTPAQFESKVKNLQESNKSKQLYWGITGMGQFQVYVTVYTKD